MTNTINVSKVRMRNSGTRKIQSVNFTTGYNVDFTRKDGSKGKVREFTRTEISKWLKAAMEAGEKAASNLGGVLSKHIIPRPMTDTEKMLKINF